RGGPVPPQFRPGREGQSLDGGACLAQGAPISVLTSLRTKGRRGRGRGSRSAGTRHAHGRAPQAFEGVRGDATGNRIHPVHDADRRGPGVGWDGRNSARLNVISPPPSSSALRYGRG